MKRNVIFILTDAVRWDRLSHNGYRKPTSPNIDRLAAKGLVFKNAYCHINTTAPSLTAIMTGCYPWTTGVTFHFDRPEAKRQNLPERFKLISELLRMNGYYTYSSEWLGAWFKRGNIWTMPATYFEDTYLQAEELVDWALERLRMIDEPYYLFLHFFDAHWPYRCPKSFSDIFYEGENPYEGDLEPIRRTYNPEAYMNFLRHSGGIRDLAYMDAQYDGEIRYLDENLGRLLEYVDDDTLIILTSDHGENLGEDDLYYVHYGLRDNVIHVPLIFWCPNLIEHRVRLDLTEHVDVLPTLLSLLNIKYEGFMDGVDLTERNDKKYVASMECRVRIARCIRTVRYKLLEVQSWFRIRYHQPTLTVRAELYDLKEDPLENVNIAQKNLHVLKELSEIAHATFQHSCKQ